MATIVTNVKERLRSRSRHRFSTRGRSMDETRPPMPSVAITGWQQGPAYEEPKTLRQEALGTPAYESSNRFSMQGRQLPQIEQSGGLGVDPGLMSPPILADATVPPAFPQTQGHVSQQAVPDRFSSLRRKDRPKTSDGQARSHRRAVSEQVPKTSYANVSRKAVPPRPLFSHPPNQTRHIPIASTSPQLNQYENDRAVDQDLKISGEDPSPRHDTVQPNRQRFPPRKDSLEYGQPPRGRMAGHQTARSVDLAPNDTSPLVPRFRDKEHELLATAGTRQAMKIPDDVRVPENFDLSSYERTDVETSWHPAITQEVVHRQKTEIIHKEITRDIHVHHYYEYFQPIKVVEILPARHWYIDPATGKKIEIPEPTGWEVPEGIKPYKPDTSTIKKKTRHYMVDEGHPYGIEEEPSDPHDARGRNISVSSATAATAA